MWPFTHWLRRADSVSNTGDKILKKTFVQSQGKRLITTRFRPQLEELEDRIVPSFADGNGTVITNLAAQSSGTELVITFDGPLATTTSTPISATPAQDPTNIANYSVQVPGSNPEVITSTASTVSITSATYNSTTFQVTLNLGSALVEGTAYRVFINGTASADGTTTPGLIDANGNTIDGDYDDTASGNFYALFSWTTAGTPLNFTDSSGNQVTLSITGPGQLETWRALDGDFDATNLALQAGLAAGAIQQLTVADTVSGQTTTLSGSAANTSAVVVVPSIAGQGITFTNALPPYFQLTPAPLPPSPTPVVATSSNLPYTLKIIPISSNLPAVQSPVSAQDNVAGSPFDGYWLMFGGRDNGLHTFNGSNDFPPQDQNENIYVVNPTTWQTWTLPWSATDVSAAMAQPLYSSNQQTFQQGNTLYTVGGYGDPDLGGGTFAANYTTYDTLTALSVDGLIRAVVNGGSVTALSQIQQISDSRLQVTGGEMQLIGNQAFLVLGQDFQGDYFSPTATQTYTDEIQSFQISYNGAVPGSLGIANYQAQNDQVNFRRRDYNLGNILDTSQQPALEVYGGVFTPGAQTDPSNGQGYQNPIVVNGIGNTQAGTYQQYFSQYSSPNIGLYDSATQSMYTIFIGGISLYDYNFATGQLIQDAELPFVDDVTTLQQTASGSQEYEMPSQLPGYYGAEARFFATPGLPEYSNGVINLNQLSHPTTLGFMFGGILSTVQNTTDQTTQTSATNALFEVELVPNPPVSPVSYEVADFKGYGVQFYDVNTSRWQVLTPADATVLGVTANGVVIADFKGYGVQYFNLGTYNPALPVTWTPLVPAAGSQDPTLLSVAANGVVAADFAPYGAYLYDPTNPTRGWQLLTTANPTLLSVGGNGSSSYVIGDFAPYGVDQYDYNSATPGPAHAWNKLSTANATLLAVNSNGTVYGDFQGYGLQMYLAGTSWQSLGTPDATALAVNSNGQVTANLGQSGVYLYSSTTGWQSLHTPENASLLTLDVNGNVVADFPGYGIQIGNLSGFNYLGYRTGDAFLLATSQD